jgi:hypothetical protein
MEVTLDELKSLLCNGAGKVATSPLANNTLRIVILHRGWVVVGRVTQTPDEVTIHNASVVRVWGTTKGIGEIALNGPNSKTVLDPCGTMRVHPLAVVGTVDCAQEKWNGH